MSLATLNGATSSKLRLQVPSWGAWFVDLDLTEPAELSGAAALSLAGQAMTGRILSGGVAHGRAGYRIIGGRGKWGATLRAKAYNTDNGVKLSTVLGDAARELGETIADVPSTSLGPHFARAAMSGFELLNLLAPQNWYIDFEGVTRIGARPTTAYTGNAPRVRVDPGFGVTDLAVDSLAGLVPGVTVDGSLPATDLEFELSPDRLTARVYAGRSKSRRLQALARIFRALDPGARYRALYEYRVSSQVGDRFQLLPARAATGMPAISRVPARGPAGIRATTLPGSLVLVAFVDADPSRPCVIAHDAWDAPGWMPLIIELGGPAVFPVALGVGGAQASARVFATAV